MTEGKPNKLLPRLEDLDNKMHQQSVRREVDLGTNKNNLEEMEPQENRSTLGRIADQNQTQKLNMNSKYKSL